jgi:hypothetical protein
MGKQRHIAVDQETYNAIVELADISGRTIGGQVKAMIKILKGAGMREIGTLPGPEDAMVPMVNMKAEEEE